MIKKRKVEKKSGREVKMLNIETNNSLTIL